METCSPMPLCFLPPKGTLLFSRLYWFTQTYMETASSQSGVNTRASEPRRRGYARDRRCAMIAPSTAS